MANNTKQNLDPEFNRTSFYQLLVGKDMFVIGIQFLLFMFFLADILVGQNYQNPGLALLLIPGIGIASIALATFRKSVPNYFVITQFAYYLTLVSLLVFIVPVFGTYYIVLPIVMFSTIYWYGFKGFIAGLLAAVGIIAAGLFAQFDAFTSDVWWTVARTIMITLFGSVLFWRMLRSDISGATSS